MNRPRADTYALGGSDSKHKVIFSRSNTTESSRYSNKYSDGDGVGYIGREEVDTDNLSVYNVMDESKDIVTETQSGLAFYCIGDENRWNFLCFCVGVSLSTAPVFSTLFWAPVVLDHHYAGIGNGCFFLVYAFTSFCLAKSIINILGCTRTFIYCHMGNLLYCICFLVEFTVLMETFDIHMSTSGTFYPLVASVGGFSQSLMWTAHVKYFNRCAQLMLKSMNTLDIENLNRSLASTFAFIYFISLCVVFLSCVLALLNDFSANQILAYFFSMYLVAVTIVMYLLCRLDDMGDKGEAWTSFQFRRGLLEMIIGVRMLPSDTLTKLLCLIPYHVAWGCTNSFWVYYILGEVVNNEQSRGFVGIVCVVDFSTSLAFSYLGNKMTKCVSSSQTPMIIWGWLCMTTIGVLVLTLSNHELGTRRRIIAYAVTHGMARAVYENNQKAVIANFFPEHETVAYSVTSFSKTLTSGITFLYYAYLVTRDFYGAVVIVTSGMGMIGYVAANVINQREMADGYKSMRSSSLSGSLVSEATSDSPMFVADYF